MKLTIKNFQKIVKELHLWPLVSTGFVHNEQHTTPWYDLRYTTQVAKTAHAGYRSLNGTDSYMLVLTEKAEGLQANLQVHRDDKTLFDETIILRKDQARRELLSWAFQRLGSLQLGWPTQEEIKVSEAALRKI